VLLLVLECCGVRSVGLFSVEYLKLLMLGTGRYLSVSVEVLVFEC
jgi:hypothetical protein